MKLERSLYEHYRQFETPSKCDSNNKSSTDKDPNSLPCLPATALKHHPNFHFMYDNVDQGLIEINEKLQQLYSIEDIEHMTRIIDTYNHHDQIVHNEDGMDPSTDTITNAEELGQELFHLHVPLGGSVLNMSSNHISRLVNADVVTPPNPDSKIGGLLIASYLGASDPQILAQYKVRLVVQCAIEHKGRIDNNILSKALQIEVAENLKNTDFHTFSLGTEPVTQCEVLELAFQDYDTIDLLGAIAAGLPVMNRTRNKNKTILVNCAAGISRSASTVIAHLMVYEKLSLIESIRKLRKARPIVLPNIGFLVQLMRLERGLNKYRNDNNKNTLNNNKDNNVALSTNNGSPNIPTSKPELPEDCLRSHMMYSFAFDNDDIAKEYVQEKLNEPVPVSMIEEMIQYSTTISF